MTITNRTANLVYVEEFKDTKRGKKSKFTILKPGNCKEFSDTQSYRIHALYGNCNIIKGSQAFKITRFGKINVTKNEIENSIVVEEFED